MAFASTMSRRTACPLLSGRRGCSQGHDSPWCFGQSRGLQGLSTLVTGSKAIYFLPPQVTGPINSPAVSRAGQTSLANVRALKSSAQNSSAHIPKR
jgi:hypothetical protein